MDENCVKCDGCGKGVKHPLEDLTVYKGKRLCKICMGKEADKPNVCPNCGAEAKVDSQVGMVLVPPEHTAKDKMEAPVYYAVVCPECKIVYFDEFQYHTLRAQIGPEA